VRGGSSPAVTRSRAGIASRTAGAASQAGDLGKEMAGSQDVGGFASHWKEVPVLPAGEGVPETGLGSGEDQQAASGGILPVENRSLSH
jgi:hypothetical protein